jgi:Leucine-rich repeat (LRR) protein
MNIHEHQTHNNTYDVGSELQDIGLEEQGQAEIIPKEQGVDTSAHDQLPAVEEYKASQQVGGTSRQCRKVSIAIALGIVVATILIIIGVVIGRDTSAPYAPVEQETSPGNDLSDAETAERFADVTTLISNMGWARASILRDPTSPQMKAAEWLTSVDPMQMEVYATEEFMNRYLLATLYFSLNGENWAYDVKWLSSSKVCDWKTTFETEEGIPIEVGVSCHDSEHVKEIFLPNMNMKGTLPDEIGLLFDLELINFFGNFISGGLPDTMKNLKSLQMLILHDNAFKGSLPEWIASLTNLETLNLAKNHFSGKLPAAMGSAMTSLQTLILESNTLGGTLDPLLNAKMVNALYLGDNDFEGELKDDVFESWHRIQIMDISENNLNGPLPSFLFAKDDLLVVDLHSNNFADKLPGIVEGDSTIEFLALQDNELTGSIGNQLLQLTRLAHLDLSKNFFTGNMPTSLGEMKSLKYLYLAYNMQLNNGPIPVQYATLPNLVDLSLQQTNRNGTIPYQFEALDKLVLFDVNANKLSGSIPLQIGGMSSLTFLMLKDNNLSGTIPATLQALTRLDTLLLDHNRFTAGYESICEPKLPRITTFIADCPRNGDCTCCTQQCCSSSDTSCNNITWFSGVDPIAANGYVRDNYFFHEDDIIFPAPKNVIPNYYKNYTGYYSKPP